MSTATSAGWLAWLMPWLVMAGLAFCVLRARRRQQRRLEREPGRGDRGGPASAGAQARASRSATLAPAVPAAALPAGREAGRREVEALETLRGVAFGDREEAALQAQLARAPRDVGALFGLLQWHARRGDRAQVESFAHALWDETDAEGELWRRAAVLGHALDPDNPLYSGDPFTALAEHAARQPTRAPLALDAFDLSVSDAPGASSATHPGDGSGDAVARGVAGAGAVPAPRVPGSTATSPASDAPPPAFDFLNAPSARLPASFADLDLDLDPPVAPDAANRPRKVADRRRNRGKGTRSSDA